MMRWDLLGRLSADVTVAPNGCWEWRRSRTAAGYGQIMWDGRAGYTHRLAYEMLVGPIPAGLVIDHLCRNRGCCNPDHLEVVTRGENVKRGAGPTNKGERKPYCKYGHERTLMPNGRRFVCKTCNRLAQHK